MSDSRIEPPLSADERETLLGFLNYQRRTLEMKCAGLDANALTTRSVPPSILTLLGLVRHLSDVERHWIRCGLLGLEESALYWDGPGGDTDFEFPTADTALVPASWAAWRAETDFTDAAIAAMPLNATYLDHHHGQTSLRWILVHLIEEYARHNGHADLLRELIDGSTGE